MSPSHSTRPARDGEIPDRFIVNWRKSPKPAPLIRRAITACENCRAAKVRCNGQQDCQRCVARQLVCTYAHRTASPALGPSPSHETEKDLLGSPPPSAHATGQVQSQYLSSLVDMSHTAAATTAAAAAAAAPGYLDSSSATQGLDTDIESVLPLGWGDALPSTVSSLLPSLAAQTAPTRPCSLPSQSQSIPFHSNSGPYLSDTTTQPAYLQDNYGLLADAIESGGQRTGSVITSPPSLGPQTGSQSFIRDPAACPCRANLMIWVSKITRVMQGKRPDEVLKVTSEVAKFCQEIVDCKTDEARCSDLLLIMSVLQETRTCFDFIAKSGFLEGHDGNTGVKLCFGGYEIVLHDAGVRAMMAMDLVQRAAAVVTSISDKGQSMINELAEPCKLAEANVAYLEANISQFKSMLACVARHVEEAVIKAGGDPAVSGLLSRNAI